MVAKSKYGLIFYFLLIILPIYSQSEALIPYPMQLERSSGYFCASNPGLVFKGVTDQEQLYIIAVLKKYWPKASDTSSAKNTILIEKTPTTGNKILGSYELTINSKSIKISADNEDGLYYGAQTLAQLMESKDKQGIPAMYIKDEPRFPYRGMHLDVSRHFFDVEFIKKQLDVMAFYKLNRFHWHLTDGPGWRLQIKQYPELTDIAAWRTHHQWKEWWANNHQFVKQGTPGAYGGFYTADDMKEILEYAKARHITVIPEIEMPGHSEEVLVVYPHLACSGKPYVDTEFCVGNEDTFKFIENVLTEVIDLFPSEYIHIGGDEAYKKGWAVCPKCQKRMRDEGLKNTEELQSYFIKRVDKFLVSKGRRLLGWDEILEGGLSENATVMSWRGEKGGIKAVRMGHDAIMTPGAFCYLDAYQDIPAYEPEANSGYVTLSKAYSYNPVPDSLSSEEAKRILGVQGNVWTEYMPTYDHTEYMIWPRLIALAEVGWCTPENNSWDRFRVSVNRHIPLLQNRGINAFPVSNSVELTQQVDYDKKLISLQLSTARIPAEIRYTLDGSEPNANSQLYCNPIIVKDTANLAVAMFNNGKKLNNTQHFESYVHQGVGAKVTYNKPYKTTFKAAFDKTLTDGKLGGYSHTDGIWQGFQNGVDVVVDLGEVKKSNLIRCRFIQFAAAGICYPAAVDIYTSVDGVNYTLLNETVNQVAPDVPGFMVQNFDCDKPFNARYIKCIAPRHKSGITFIDEIIVR